MGEEAPEYDTEIAENYPIGIETNTYVGTKIYTIGGSDGGDIDVIIGDKLTGKWTMPIVLGNKPMASVHSAIDLGDKILVLKEKTYLNDCAWFLELDTPYVREQTKLLGSEVVAWSKGVLGNGPEPIVISGPSGVGKGTLISKLMNEFPSTFGFSVSHTTRSPREKEINGVHYHFTERWVMEKDISEGKFLESALVHGNLYGTSVEAVDAVTDAGKRCILDIDVQGARSVRASSLKAKFIFICPPSFEELEKRLRLRGTETEEQVQKRLRNAKAELEQGTTSGIFDHILVNDDLDSCYRKLKKLLNLEVAADASSQNVNSFSCPSLHSVTKEDKKIKINIGNGYSNMAVIDVTDIKGGAPGRTRGIQISTVAHQ